MLTIIQSQLGFTYTFVDSVDGIPGIMASDGNWTGLMGMLQRKEIDFSLMANTMIPQRAMVRSTLDIRINKKFKKNSKNLLCTFKILKDCNEYFSVFVIDNFCKKTQISVNP